MSPPSAATHEPAAVVLQLVASNLWDVVLPHVIVLLLQPDFGFPLLAHVPIQAQGEEVDEFDEAEDTAS